MGMPVVHWEMWSRDAETAARFYEQVFDWQIQHIPELSYRVVKTGAAGSLDGGIMEPKQGPLPGNLTFYVDVADLAEYRRKIVDAGGSILVEEQEIPGMGKICLFADPEARVIGLWQRA